MLLPDHNIFFGCVCLIFLAGCTTSDSSQTEISDPPNILFLIADDWSYPHAGVLGDPVILTPTFDRLATEGAIFHQAYCASPSCSPSRAAILSSRYPHQLKSGANLWSVIRSEFPTWVGELEKNGYHTGRQHKGWAPGDYLAGGFEENPAGKSFDSFNAFLEDRDPNQPFCYWFGSFDPHRDYESNTGVKTGMDAEAIEVPAFLPDLPCVRSDILDYYFEVERFDRECGQILRMLEQIGELENTLIIMTSDNGMPFPRAKANLYDFGTHMPLAMRWPGQIEAGSVMDGFTNSVDLGPTILEAAGVPVPETFSGESLWPVIRGEAGNTVVYLERERHANVRAGNLSYPSRAIRDRSFLYIRNFEPERWPAGDPTVHQSIGQYGDVDNSITKFLIMNMEDQSTEPSFFNLAFSKRPEEELYDINKDPYQLTNLAGDRSYSQILEQYRTALDAWMSTSEDLRASDPQTIYWDTVRYTPDYQHQDVDLQAELREATYLKSSGAGKFTELPCVE